LSAEENDGSMRPDLGLLCRWIEALGRNQAILIDRLDYLIAQNDIAKTLHFVHRLREIAYMKGHVIIISLDPGTLGPMELRGFEKEALEIQTRTSNGLPGDMMETLKYVYQQNVVGVKPTMTGLCTELRLSRPTARKRIRMLVRTGHLLLSARGRTKVLELTEKGRRAFPG
jgi:predicted transcriptional regulator